MPSMKNQSHTPGPWFVEAGKEAGDFAIHADLTQHGHVNKPPLVNTSRLSVPFAQSKANANLIAAAPELLKAISGIMNLLMGDGVQSEDIRATDEWDFARMVINAAEGR